MSSQDNTPSSLCRIVGLTSEAGKKRNGSAARVNLSERSKVSGNDVRHPVSIDGFPGPMSIKAANVEVFPQVHRSLSVGVGRGTLLDTTFKAALVEDGRIVDDSFVTGGAARCRGNIEAMDLFARRLAGLTTNNSKPILVELTDLNVARALNRVANGEQDVKLASPLNAKFQKISKTFNSNKKAKNFNVMVKFLSHRVSADEFQTKKDKQGPQRYAAAKLGAYQIYPCALKQYLDAHEVRYADTSGKRKVVEIHHEIYLDYGVEETTSYVRHAAALEECDRLHPKVLSEVDPQMFWAALLWSKPFIRTLEELNLSSDLIDEWKDLESTGKEMSRNHFKKASIVTGNVGLKGVEDNWGITRSQDVHIRIATDYAIGAVEAVRKAIGIQSSPVRINTLDYYKGTELDKYIFGVSKFHEMMINESVEKGEEPSLERTGRIYDKAMKSVGFKRDSKFRIQDPEKVCSSCGKRSKKKLLACARW